MKKTIKCDVPIFRDAEGNGRVLCPLCSRLHSHGLGEAERSSDCSDLAESGTYRVFTVPGEMPEEARKIDKKARKIMMLLYDRRDRGGWFHTRWKKPTTEYLKKWEDLKNQVSKLNTRIFMEEKMTIVNGVLIRPEMTEAEACSLLGNLTDVQISAMPHDAVITLLVKNKGGVIRKTEDGELDFEMPPLPPEELAAQEERSRIALEAYAKEHGL